VDVIHADPEFTPLQAALPQICFNFCAQKEHVPDIERFIRTVKDRVRSAYNMVPFKHIPRLVIIRLVANAVFWLNAFPQSDGVSNSLSSRYLLTGRHLDYTKHVRSEFGAYDQTHEQHTNDMNARTLGAICLGPSGNEQGGHYFMPLASTGKRIHRHRWTELPMPDNVIDRVNALGRQQGMPRTLTFADRYGFAITNDDQDVDDDHDSEYDSDNVSDGNDDDFASVDYDEEDYDDDNDDNDANAGHVPPNNVPNLPVDPTGVEDEQGNEDGEEDVPPEDEDEDTPPMPADDQSESDNDSDSDDDDDHNVDIPGVGPSRMKISKSQEWRTMT
jgi:hypothetical protein